LKEETHGQKATAGIDNLKAGVLETMVHARRLVAHVTAASEQDRGPVSALAGKVPEVPGEAVAMAFVDQG
jgi:hypothetical protein